MRKRGFTLLEVICTVSLLVILYAVLLNNWNFSSLGTSYETDAVISDINYIKSLSFQGDDEAKIIFNIPKNSYTIKSKVDDEEISLKNIRLESCTNDELKFARSGWTKGTTVNINSQDRYYKLTVSAITGRIKLKEDEKRIYSH